MANRGADSAWGGGDSGGGGDCGGRRRGLI